jgi:hypothetical protein
MIKTWIKKIINISGQNLPLLAYLGTGNEAQIKHGGPKVTIGGCHYSPENFNYIYWVTVDDGVTQFPVPEAYLEAIKDE